MRSEDLSRLFVLVAWLVPGYHWGTLGERPVAFKDLLTLHSPHGCALTPATNKMPRRKLSSLCRGRTHRWKSESKCLGPRLLLQRSCNLKCILHLCLRLRYSRDWAWASGSQQRKSTLYLLFPSTLREGVGSEYVCYKLEVSRSCRYNFKR